MLVRRASVVIFTVMVLSGVAFPAARGAGDGTDDSSDGADDGSDTADARLSMDGGARIADIASATPTEQLLSAKPAMQTAPWLADVAEFPEVRQRRGQIYNRIFRYRGALENVHEAYALWFDCLFARALPALMHGPALTPEAEKFCGRLGHRIAREQRARLAPVHDVTEREHPAHQTQQRTAPVSKDAYIVSSTPSRDAFLDLYSQQTRPLILKDLGADMVTDTKSALEACLQNEHPTAAEEDADVDEGERSIHHSCMDYLRSHYHLPEFASEDVLQVVDAKLHEVADAATTTDEATSTSEALRAPRPDPTPHSAASLATRWPTLWRADVNAVSENACTHGPTQAPGGAHLLIVPLRGGSLIVRVYGPKHHHTFPRTVTVGGRRLYSAEGGAAGPRDADTESVQIELAYPDVLFIPSGSIYSWSCVCNGSTKEAGIAVPSVVLTHGFVDAGALTHFINELTLDAAQDPEPYRDGVLRVVIDMHGGKAPFRRTTAVAQVSSTPAPALLPWGEFKRGATILSTTAANGKPVMKRRRRSHKEWRMQKLWERKLLSIIPPRPASVHILYSGWELVQLEIELPFGPSSTFSSVHKGFVLSWSLLNNETMLHSPNATGWHAMTLQDHCQIKNNPTKQSGDYTGVSSNDISSTTYICTCRALRTASIYAFRVAVLTSTAVGPNSEPVAAKTRELSVPPRMPAPTSCGFGLRKVPQGTPTTLLSRTHAAHIDMFSLYACIEVLPPMDNGGKSIEDLLIRWRRSGKHHTYTHDPFVFHLGTNETDVAVELGHPARVTKYVHNIVPNATLLFSVATRTSVGTSAWSPELEVDSHAVQSKEGPITVHAPLVDFDYQDPVDPLEEDRNRTVQSMHQNPEGPVLIMSRRRHSITLVDPDGTKTQDIDAWGLHFAPSSHDVRGMLVIAEPLDAHVPLLNADEVRGNIVLIERGGGYPFRDKVMHAQKAGAIGVVFMDHGQCSTKWTQGCVPGASKHNGEGFAMQDAVWAWTGLDTPAVIVNKEHGELLISKMAAPLM